MIDSHYPEVDTEFIIKCIKQSKLCFNTYNYDNSIYFIKKGTGPIAKRISHLNEKSKTICLYHAINLSHTYVFADLLSDWLIKNKNWKDGAYFVPQTKN
jgi:hypothetical protein